MPVVTGTGHGDGEGRVLPGKQQSERVIADLAERLEAAEARIEAVREVCDAWMAGSAPSAIKDVLAALDRGTDDEK